MRPCIVSVLLSASSSSALIPTQWRNKNHRRQHHHHHHHHHHHRLFAYGRGAEIWPPSNDKQAIRLADSFPNNQLPLPVQAILARNNEIEAVSSPSPASWRRPLSMILQRAAARAQSETVADGTTVTAAAAAATSTTASYPKAAALDKTPALLAICLIAYTKPLDALLAMFLTGYLAILVQISRQPRSSENDVPILPTLPPQGHVPYLISNPLGFSFADSAWYDRWLRAGVLLGLVAPVTWTIQYSLKKKFVAASLTARPLFFLCLQALVESSLAGRVVMAALPLRILASVMFNVVRIAYVWQWATTTVMPLGIPGRLLAVLNMVYWSANLFGFLIPVGVMRYMRAHFFCVEAEQVITRRGMQDSIGLIP